MAWDDNLDPNSVPYAIAADRSRFIRVVAGPGTGKSFALKRRVARLLEDKIDPRRILPVTFTRLRPRISIGNSSIWVYEAAIRSAVPHCTP